MRVSCKNCKRYQRMIATRDLPESMVQDLGCLTCAYFPERKSHYEPIKYTQGEIQAKQALDEYLFEGEGDLRIIKK
ncbi:hypothetical protein ES708_18680 [subsurface metagenome]